MARGDGRELIWVGSTLEDLRRFKLETAVYTLHAFQKKSKSGIATPPRDLDLVKRRLAEAETIDKELAENKGRGID